LVAEGEKVKTVLFLCTDNYCRSRFAAELFKSERIPGWGCRKFEITDVVAEP
jgi:protein-tyrosine-phosphatase